MSNENTNATSNKRKRREDDAEESIEIPPVSILKRSRNEASSSNLSRVKFGNENQIQNQGKPSKAQLKMAKRLEPILPTLATLPVPLATQFKAFATLILSCKIEIIHCKKKNSFPREKP